MNAMQKKRAARYEPMTRDYIILWSNQMIVVLLWSSFLVPSICSPCGYDMEAKSVSPKLKRYVIDDVKQITLPLTLANTDRVSHRLTNAIFKKFIEDRVGYQEVEYVHIEDLQSIYIFDDERDPIAMVDLEVWVPPGTSDNREDKMHNLGSQNTAGRYNWYIRIHRNASDEIVDHWRSFQKDSVTQLFALDDDELKKIKDDFTKDKNGDFFCTSDKCSDGIYTPDRCKFTAKCATLFAGEFSYSDFLIKQIDDQELLVQVAWIDLNLTPQFIRRFRNGQPIIYFSWWPSPISVLDDISPVSFPSCTEVDPRLNDTYLCRYELHTLRKIAWDELKNFADKAYEAVERFSLRDSDYRYLLRMYNSRTNFDNFESLLVVRDENWDGDIIEDIAGSWMGKMSNSDFINQWRPTDYNVKPKLWLAGIFPVSDSSIGRYSSKTLANAADLAICEINRNSSILNAYTIDLKTEDGRCDSDEVLFSYIKFLRAPYLNMNRLIGILGPSCSDTVEPLAGITKLLKTVIISYSAEGAIFNDQGKYPYFFRTIPENKIYRYVYLQLFQELKWKQLATVTEVGNKYSEYLTLLEDVLQPENITIHNRKLSKEARKNPSEYMAKLKKINHRIIIGDFYSEMACEIFCEAYKLNMTAKQGYVWFIPRWFKSKWYDTDEKYKDAKGVGFSCTTKQMLEALDGHLSLGYAYYMDDNEKFHSGKTVENWKKNYGEFSDSPLADYAGYTYDAVWTYAFALNSLLKEKFTHAVNMHSNETNKRFVEILRQTDFVGVSGHISFKNGSSRNTVVHISQFDSNFTSEEGNYRVIGRFTPDSMKKKTKNGGKIALDLSTIRWLNSEGTIPGDGSPPETVCIFASFSDLLGLNCELTIVITMLIAFIIFVIIVVIGVIYKTKYEKVQSRNLGMDEWEIPRERVVINRTIGAGAFGTVYGGECRIKVDGPWVAVAVKTLKVGSDSNFDFLYEAIMMKEFDHKNIVRLIGLATLIEPIYMIMEFMLYGDLKTYLLARRHLVSERASSNDNHEISNRRLTSMSLDVACALDYLASNKYVHRDVACRNCLVNADRVIKLSDFGMTRPIYESNYYRYNRKGMLPVRWMARESIEDGVYTTMTDVWSFGVLLYEIITFGNFPFQGMNNDQVLEGVVKHGVTIRVPPGLCSPLKRILHNCWLKLPDERPTFNELMELFTNSPRLIEPCLEVPTASVETDQNQDAPTAVYSNNLIARPQRARNGLDIANAEPLLPPGEAYITRYACLQRNRSPEATDVPLPSTTST